MSPSATYKDFRLEKWHKYKDLRPQKGATYNSCRPEKGTKYNDLRGLFFCSSGQFVDFLLCSRCKARSQISDCITKTNTRMRAALGSCGVLMNGWDDHASRSND